MTNPPINTTVRFLDDRVQHHALSDAVCQARAVCAAWEIVQQWAVDSDDLAGRA